MHSSLYKEMVFNLFRSFSVSVPHDFQNGFFSSLTGVRIKTRRQILVKLDMLLRVTVLHFIISKTINVHFCKSWCIVKVLTTDCITFLLLSYSCCYFFPTFKNIVQKTDSSSFNFGVTITGYFFIFIFIRHW